MSAKNLLENPLILSLATLGVGIALGISGSVIYKNYSTKSNTQDINQNVQENLPIYNVDQDNYVPTTNVKINQEPTNTNAEANAEQTNTNNLKNTQITTTIKEQPTPGVIKYKTAKFTLQGTYDPYSYVFSFKVPVSAQIPAYKENKQRIAVTLDSNTKLEIFLAPEAYVVGYKAIVQKLNNTIFGPLTVVKMQDDTYSYTNKVLATTGSCNGIYEKIPAPCGYANIRIEQKLENKYPAIISITCKSTEKNKQANLGLCNTAVSSLQISKQEKTISFNFTNNGKTLNVQFKAPIYCNIKKYQGGIDQTQDLYCANIHLMRFTFGPRYNNVHYDQLLSVLNNPQLGEIQSLKTSYYAASRSPLAITYVLKQDVKLTQRCAPINGNLIQPPCGPNQLNLPFSEFSHIAILCQPTNKVNYETICNNIMQDIKFRQL